MRVKSKLFLLLGLLMVVALAAAGCALPMAADEHTHEDGADHTHDEEMPDGGFVIGVSPDNTIPPPMPVPTKTPMTSCIPRAAPATNSP